MALPFMVMITLDSRGWQTFPQQGGHVQLTAACWFQVAWCLGENVGAGMQKTLLQLPLSPGNFLGNLGPGILFLPHLPHRAVVEKERMV